MTNASQSGSSQTVSSTTATTAAHRALKVDEAALAWLKNRGISRETLALAPVASGRAFFPELDRKSEAVFFGYQPGQWKARAYPEKAFVAAPGFKPEMWNIAPVLECLATGPAPIYLTEGEMDALSLIEAGIPNYQVASVPNGAGKPSGEKTTIPPYLAGALSEGLHRASRFIWCGDTDQPGLAMRQHMAECLGAAKFSFVDWPEGCKDANDVLLKHGPDLLRNTALSGAKQWPAYGLFTLSELPEPPPLELWEPKWSCLQGKLWLAPRTLSVVTGQPGHGKTQAFGEIWYGIISRYNVTACIASFETRPKPHLQRQIRTLYSGAPEMHLSDEEKALADGFIETHYLFLQHPEQRPSLEWFLDQAEIAVVRHGAKIIQLDPWNRLASGRERDETETEYIARCLRALHIFAHDMNCHVQIVAHPAKLDSHRKGSAPSLEDISGSKHFENMVDQGFVIHRDKLFNDDGSRCTEARFICLKSRFEELGYPFHTKIKYDLDLKRYVSVVEEEEE